MALIVTTETGTGAADANSYASVADCDAYHEAHTSPAAWTGATADQKKAAVVMATRTIDQAVDWAGSRRSISQGLEWPRYDVPRRGGGPSQSIGAGQRSQLAAYWPDNEIPRPLRDAVCELARLLLESDRTADDGSKGLKKVGLGDGAIEIEFDPADRSFVLSDQVLRYLSQFGSIRGRSMIRKVKRVQ